MARIRSQHPTQWTDEQFVSCSAFARLLVLAIRNEADDQGVFEWKPITLKMRLFPADNVDIDALLSELVENNHVVKFDECGKSYGAIRNFRKFQRPKKPNSVYPLPNKLRNYVGLEAEGSEPTEDKKPDSAETCTDKDAASSEPVGNQWGTSGENPPQMEEVIVNEGDSPPCSPPPGGGENTQTPDDLTAIPDFLDRTGQGSSGDVKPKRKRGTRIPDDWRPDADCVEYARSRGFNDEQIAEITLDFTQHFQNKTGKGSTMLNWNMTWQTWVRSDMTARKFNKPNGGRQNPGQEMQAAFDKIHAEMGTVQ